MTVKMIQESYGNTTEILMYPDHYVAEAHTFKKNDSAATTVGTRKIVKAGTIYPTNDASARGVVFYDVDVTDGDQTGALIIHGFVDAKKCTAQPAEQALAALKLVHFVNATNSPKYPSAA